MSKIVIKFGGSNLKQRKDILRLVETVKAYNESVIIVVSAFYGITNHLLDVLHKAKTDITKIEMLTAFLLEMKNDIITQNVDDEVIKQDTIAILSQRIGELEKYLLGVHYIGDVPDFVEDIVLSYGERFSSLILNAILKSHGVDSNEVMPEDIGLYTDGEFGDATIDFQVSEPLVSANLADDKVFVIPGFYGISKEHKVTLLGRGGTDYSAASIAHCINARSLDIWKDVEGFLSADPKLVDNVKPITHLTYTEAAELAYFGARILHPRTVEPLMDKEIPIRLFNIETDNCTLNPLSIISSEKVISDGVIKSIAFSDDFAILKLKGPGIGLRHGILARVTTRLNDHDINIKSVITSQIAINLLLAPADLEKANSLMQQMDFKAVKEILTLDGISIIAVVGEGILDQYGIAGRMYSAVAEHGINILIGVVGGSQVSAYLIVNRTDCQKAIKAIHQVFFG